MPSPIFAFRSSRSRSPSANPAACGVEEGPAVASEGAPEAESSAPDEQDASEGSDGAEAGELDEAGEVSDPDEGSDEDSEASGYQEEQGESEVDPDFVPEEEEDDDDGASDWGSREESDDTLSSGSVRSAPSDGDFDPEHPATQYAQIVPEPPWSSLVGPCLRLTVACFLPVLLLVLSVYGLYRVIKFAVGVVFDIFWVIRRCLRLLVCVLLLPSWLCWRFLVPSMIRKAVWHQFDHSLGARLRRAVVVKLRVENFVADLPLIALACQMAAVETFIGPLRKHGGTWAWLYLGRHLEVWVLKPLEDASVNRTFASKRRQAHDLSRKEELAGGEFARRAWRRNRLQAKRRKEKAKRAQARKKRKELQITLRLEQDPQKAAPKKVQLKERGRHDTFSRSMLVERRYAIAVGFAWFVVGGAVILISLDGIEGMRCVICEDREGTQVQMCRNGIGHDCAFQEYSTRIVLCIFAMAVGCLIIVYALFLHKPRRRQRASGSKKKLRRRVMNSQADVTARRGDNDIEVVEFLLELREKRTAPRILKQLFRRSAIGRCFSNCSFFMNGPLVCLFRWEARHRCRERSVVVQRILYEVAMGWLARLCKCLFRRRGSQSPRGLHKTLPEGVGSRCWFLYASCVSRFRRSCCGRVAGRCFDAVASTRCGQAVGRWVVRSPRLRAFMTAMSGGSWEWVSEGGTMSVGVDGRRSVVESLNTLEATLARFGLLESVEMGHTESVQRAAMDTTVRDTQLELGAMDGDFDIVEEEPEVMVDEMDSDLKDLEEGLPVCECSRDDEESEGSEVVASEA